MYVVVGVHVAEMPQEHHSDIEAVETQPKKPYDILEEPKREAQGCLDEQTPVVTDNQVASSNVCLVPFTSHSNPKLITR